MKVPMRERPTYPPLPARARRATATLLALAASLILAGPARAESACAAQAAAGPRVLVLAFDGVPLRIVGEARARGAFAGWAEPAALISTFPSMTNVAFTAMLGTLGAAPIAGYETRHFDAAENHLVGGGPSGYAWRKMFEVISDSFGAKTALYMQPRKRARKVLALVEEALLDHAEPPVVLAHMAPTDLLTHVRGDGATLEVILRASEMLERVILEHRRRHGRDLEVILLSDHGNGDEKVAYTHGLRDALRAAGFKFKKRLAKPHHIVAPTYAAVNYGALYLDPARAAEAAEAASRHESVEVAAWVESPGEIAIVGRRGQAKVGWRDAADRREYSYEIESGDPLHLLEARARLEGAGALDAEGFGPEARWLEASAEAEYPDALGRLVDSLTDRYVDNPATVILSLGPRYAWGQGSVRFGASVMGGRLEGTHGGLDRESSLGFLLVSNRERRLADILPAERALSAWAHLAPCVEADGP